MRPPISTTGAFNASASSTMRFMPSCERQARSAKITGFCAATSILAASVTAPLSPCGGIESVSLGIVSFFSSLIGSSADHAVGGDQHRSHRRRHGDFVGAHHRLGKMLQRYRLIVPLGKIAKHRRRILHAVIPLDAGPAFLGIEKVAGKHHRPEPGRTRRCKRPSPHAAARRCRAP